MQNNNWKTLKKDYENLSVKPSDDVWKRLNKELNEESTKAASQFNLIKIAAALLLFLTISAVFYLNQKQENFNNDVAKNTKIVEKTTAKETIDLKKIKERNQFKSETATIISEKKLAKVTFKNDEKPKLSSKLSPNNFKNIKIDSGNSIKNLALKQNLILNPEIPNAQKIADVKYIKADELLFARELNRNNNKETIQKKEKLGVINVDGIKKPKSVTILGFTVYSDSVDSN
ncbi:hypothetical protein SAMN05421847_0423 [Halpernia humi]|uniref:Uncharacterized protein n=1 Tax=Halpernia humi TaxID=493375 RepID=A0A1H5TBF3_9FLAO|nr:hypothetical protein [Halpernia humi]SEF60094.1 hypothetical protein SAMN05421847_0423 [Halpernia humi]